MRLPSSLGPRDGSDLRPAEHLVQGMERQHPQQSAAGGGSSGGGLLFDDDSLVDILMQVGVEVTMLMQVSVEGMLMQVGVEGMLMQVSVEGMPSLWSVAVWNLCAR